jgi:hypothetical protein
MPYLFEPYQTEYVFKGKPIGLSFRLFSFSTKISELPDEWRETHFIGLSKTPDADFQNIKITSNIDLKTGLLKKMVTETGKNIVGTIEIGDGNVSGLPVQLQQHVFDLPAVKRRFCRFVRLPYAG